ncbi:putative Integral membrane sensor signal transduction histidine kinase [Candidatus Sulfopaludibacter sp. SbA4]|nr:putative Integral membrane sensor signal transduction histidine kinase [Candidatus Sulfopaludibacter sp. SbA4]
MKYRRGKSRAPGAGHGARGTIRPALRAMLLLIAAVSSLQALDPRLSTTQYLHVSWTQEEGNALPAINTLAQTTDGYLWLGTNRGLWRFDGMRFVQWEPPAGEKLPDPGVLSLLASGDGGLWIRTLHNISRLERGHLAPYPEVDRWLEGWNPAISEDRAGRLWLARLGNPPEVGALLPNGALRVYSVKDGLPERSILKIFEDQKSNLWISTGRDLCKWSPGHPAECTAFPWAGIFAIPGDGFADLSIGDPSGNGALPLSESKLKSISKRLANVSLATLCLTSDRDGGVWIGTLGQGLMRMSGIEVERFQRSNGLSSDYVLAILEDREHDLWVATSRGLDRFRDPQVVHVSRPDGLSGDLVTAIQAGPDGSMWVGTAAGLNRVAGSAVTSYAAGTGFPSLVFRSLLADGAQGLWVGTTAGFGYFANGRFSEVRTSKGAHLFGVFAMAKDPNGMVWLADAQQGLFTVRGGVAQRASIPGVQMNDVYQLQVDRAGVVWLGYFHGGVATVNGGAVRNFTAKDGLAGGAIQAIAQDRSGAIWIGAAEGLSRFRNGVWTTWGTGLGVPEGGIRGIVEDDRDTLWFMTMKGLSHVDLATLNQSPDGSPQNLEFQPYGQSDGERLGPSPMGANPRTARSSDGRLWFCTENGVAIVDPARIRRNSPPPPVVIEEMVVDGTPLDITAGSEIPFRGRQVHIRYTGLSLMVPERVRFKYRLEGFDRGWRDAGSERSVDYVLPPRHYRFRVLACNHDGVWNETGASLAFYVEPYFYETRWFAALCVMTLGLIGWGVHRTRVRMVVTRYEAIAYERARLTRELHDSLLQGFVAVVYQLEAAAKQIVSAPDLGKQRLERTIEQADRALGEARRTMLAMRLPALENSTLPEALARIAGELTEGTDIGFHLDVKGRVRQLPYEEQANVFLIGREAITNSVNHARPTRILAALTYSSRQVRITIEDDGEGFNLEEGMSKDGHWGMAGMRERANQMGATFSVRSSPGEGTKVEVVVPSKV